MSPIKAKRVSTRPSLIKVVTAYCADNNLSHLSKSVCGALRAKDWRKLKAIKDSFGSPQMYKDPLTYLRYAGLIALYSKSEMTGSSADAESAALEVFKSDCARMTSVNRRLREEITPRIVFDILELAKAFIRERYRFDDYEQLYKAVCKRARHGPGGTLDVRGSGTSSFTKASSVTKSGSRGAVRMFLSDDLFVGKEYTHELVVTEYSDGAFAPKNMWTKRFIAIEPTLNTYYTLGLKEVLQSSLKTTGIDLTSGQGVNGLLAYRASKECPEFCTLDITSASNSISIELVQWLFQFASPALYDMMCDLRTPVCYINGTPVVLPMFSTMGNGFTFPLETIIFQSLVEACLKYQNLDVPYTIYGDDIIVHRDIVDNLTFCLNYLGMILNKEKSFVDGPFRESCGYDFFSGVDVRPVYVKTFDPITLIETRNRMSLMPIYDKVVEYLDGFIENFGPRVELRPGSASHLSKSQRFKQSGWAWQDAVPGRWNSDLQQYEYRSLRFVPFTERAKPKYFPSWEIRPSDPSGEPVAHLGYLPVPKYRNLVPLNIPIYPVYKAGQQRDVEWQDYILYMFVLRSNQMDDEARIGYRFLGKLRNCWTPA